MENRYIKMADEEFKKETTIFKTTANLFFFFCYIHYIYTVFEKIKWG